MNQQQPNATERPPLAQIQAHRRIYKSQREALEAYNLDELAGDIASENISTLVSALGIRPVVALIAGLCAELADNDIDDAIKTEALLFAIGLEGLCLTLRDPFLDLDEDTTTTTNGVTQS
jgi:hypothetical protein